MTKRGYFIINGIPRLITNQIIRRAGLYYQQSTHKIIKSNKVQIERRFYIDLISQRGTWLRLEVDRKQRIWARMKKAPALPALLLLQSIGLSKKIILQTLFNSFYFYKLKKDPLLMGLVFNLDFLMKSNDELVLENSRKFICRKFLNPRSYNLGEDGRNQLNYRLGLNVPKSRTTLTPYDFLLSIDSLIKLTQNEKIFDDIDHLENRRVRTSGELIQNQLNLGLIRLEKKIIEKIKKSKGIPKIQNLFTPHAINSIFKEFFGSSPLSQFLDQANPLAELTHKRRLTSIGPGGINRETAGMAIRGIHPTHYGKICPIETPEGQNAGLVNSITVFASFNKKNFIETPFFIMFKGQIQHKLGIQFLSSGFSKNRAVALSNIKTSVLGFLPPLPFTAQIQQKFKKVYRKSIEYIVISSLQLISIATSLIPFIEHDDANRALMGSNMQRQAVPLINPENPLVGTGLEHHVLFHCSDFLQASRSGLILYSSHKEIQVYIFFDNLLILSSLYLDTCLKARLTFNFYSKIKLYTFLNLKKHLSYLIKTNSSTGLRFRKLYFKKLKTYFKFNKRLSTFSSQLLTNFYTVSELCFLNYLKNIIFWIPAIFITRVIRVKNHKNKIFNFIYSTKQVYKPTLVYRNILFLNFPYSRHVSNNRTFKLINSIFLSKNQDFFKSCFNLYISKPTNFFQYSNKLKLSLNDYLRSNQGTTLIQKPNFSIKKWVEKGDLITNNFSSKYSELALGKNIFIAYLPWEGYNFEDAILINESLIYNDIYTSLHIEKYKIEIRETAFGFENITRHVPGQEYKKIDQLDKRGIIKLGAWVKEGDILVGRTTPVRQRRLLPHEKLLYDIVGKETPSIRDTSLRVPKGVEGRIFKIQISEAKRKLQKIFNIKIESVSIHILEYKKIKVGDKIAGRHGNKGIVSKILPISDSPYYPDGTPVDMILNPLGVPSRMNIGQIFESLLGLIGKKLYQKFKILPFDEIYGYEASRSLVFLKLYQTRLKANENWLFSPNYPGKFYLFDGRSGQNFNYPIMSGVSYMMKLIHLVDEKIHARSTGSYSLVTQQPLRGRSKHGGQRFGEMEVWALEGFGAAYTLQELLTVKSDDVKGRTQIMQSILKNSPLQFGTPESFKVLIRELQALCLDVRIYNQNIKHYIKI